MKKYLFIVTLTVFLSCKENSENSENYKFDESAIVVDSSFQEEDGSMYIDSAAVPAFEDDNYAGSESLSRDYTSSYYISTSYR
ncbi:hypothetical protein [Flavobacterium sp. N2820]|jgi:hypothetical protein|uniref:hypothetical protein n=1 Tax=Flavobacterium sp. N2820 TaxID=2986834 RepID=UPI002225719A|nr:hypothetical protein [Flavobacterium sp. N2820]